MDYNLNDFVRERDNERGHSTAREQGIVANQALQNFRGADFDDVQIIRDQDKLVISVYTKGKNIVAKVNKDDGSVTISQHTTETGGLVNIKDEVKSNEFKDAPKNFEVNNNIHLMDLIVKASSPYLSAAEKNLLYQSISAGKFQ